MRIPIAKEGVPFIAGSALIALLLRFFSPALFWVFVAVTGFMCNFFRDPERPVSTDPNSVCSPADGKIMQINAIEWDGKPYHHIVIFLSVFNVHINRVPYSGKVTHIDYFKGHFHAAFKDNIENENERLEMTLDTDQGAMKVVQIAGLLARRIVCKAAVGDSLEKGRRYGMIKFSSRTDLYIPAHAKVLVEKGQMVKGAFTEMARFD